MYLCLVENILSFNIITWFGHLTFKQKIKLGRVVNTVSKLIGRQQRQLSTLYDSALTRKTFNIYTDPVHPLSLAFQKLPSDRRIKVPLARKNGYNKSFIPTAVS